MGAYINPRKITKEEWIRHMAVPITNPQDGFAEGYLPVCLVDNGPFTAAAIAYDERELAAFLNPEDRRPKKWFKAKITDLLPVSDLQLYLKHQGLV